MEFSGTRRGDTGSTAYGNTGPGQYSDMESAAAPEERAGMRAAPMKAPPRTPPSKVTRREPGSAQSIGVFSSVAEMKAAKTPLRANSRSIDHEDLDDGRSANLSDFVEGSDDKSDPKTVLCQYTPNSGWCLGKVKGGQACCAILGQCRYKHLTKVEDGALQSGHRYIQSANANGAIFLEPSVSEEVYERSSILQRIEGAAIPISSLVRMVT